MKTIRMLLTTTVLLSLASTSYSSQSSEKDNDIQATRKDSFDPLRDGGPLNGWFGWNPNALAKHTLDHCGEDYQGKEVRIGSRNTTSAWTDFGKNISNLVTAQTFMSALKKSNVELPEEATQVAQGLIETEKKQRRDQLTTMNNQAISLLQGHYIATQAREIQDQALVAEYETSLKQKQEELAAILKQKQEELAGSRSKNKETLVESLTTTFQKMQTVQKSSNINFPESFVKTDKSISKKKLSNLAIKYKDGKVKVPTYAEATNDYESSDEK